ncbi:MAG: DUF1636 domain-containing protein [Aphanocapsa sp. GSE-SYN-MK-11-07L]|jgi:predicted metal-binding protein|nr:DUF1636 domain-containing protein [Aphanocapsa sp. GSE-SYN-MK-11-07L]
MTQHTLFVCALCRFSETERERDGISGGQHLLNSLSADLETHDHAFQLHPVRCMGACGRSCVVAFVAAHKLTFVFSDLPPLEAAPDLLQFSHQYLTHPTGTVPHRERPESIRKNLLVVLPPAPTSPQAWIL